MGTFLSLSTVIGRDAATVTNALRTYAEKSGGRLEPRVASEELSDSCVIRESNGHTTISYPAAFMGWDDAAQTLSAVLSTTVFSFHIHDGDFWMYLLYRDGAVIDRFNPLPGYWEEMDEAAAATWKGSAARVAEAVPGADARSVSRYLVRWDPDSEADTKAFASDQYGQEDWQLLDFMRALRLPFPFQDDGKPAGTVYRFETSAERHEPTSLPSSTRRPWWKFW
ncbi:MAG: hypothetical protein JWP27_1726 [Flaviaesturariibacter sp.]|nr:hypothetical protein [Flaviaesturariibacter sp.]